MKTVDIIAFVLLVIGGLNWGLVGFFNYNLVSAIFAGAPVVARFIYALVGLAALWDIIFYSSMRQRWMSSTSEDIHMRRAA